MPVLSDPIAVRKKMESLWIDPSKSVTESDLSVRMLSTRGGKGRLRDGKTTGRISSAKVQQEAETMPVNFKQRIERFSGC